MKVFIFSSILALGLSACNRGVICPAFQSTFIQDDSVRLAKFSMMGPDSLPKTFITDKSRVGIMQHSSYSKDDNSMKIVTMEIIFPPGLPTRDSTLQIAPPIPADSLEYQMTDGK